MLNIVSPLLLSEIIRVKVSMGPSRHATASQRGAKTGRESRCRDIAVPGRRVVSDLQWTPQTWQVQRAVRPLDGLMRHPDAFLLGPRHSSDTFKVTNFRNKIRGLHLSIEGSGSRLMQFSDVNSDTPERL